MKMKLLDLQTGKYLELGNDWLYGGNAIHISNPKSVGYYCFTQKPHTNPIINQIAEKVGAVIYGGRYVLLFSEQDTSIHHDNHYYKNGDVVRDGHSHGYVAICTASTHYSYHQNVLDIPNFQGSCESGFLFRKYEILGNIFEEFAKKEQGLENKFDELQSKTII